MAKYEIRLVTEAPSAAQAVARVAIDADGEYIGEWDSIEVRPVVPQAFARGGYVAGSSYGTVVNRG